MEYHHQGQEYIGRSMQTEKNNTKVTLKKSSTTLTLAEISVVRRNVPSLLYWDVIDTSWVIFSFASIFLGFQLKLF